jgi:ABC-type multidrug transport system fused ATPase/permease subunit
MLGLKTPITGTITVNDENIILLKDRLTPRIGYVGPEPYLIPASVKENLLYGNQNLVSDLEIWNALELAHISKDVRNLEGGLNEVLNEYTQLSTGQKQRLSIARALLRNPEILILDEATANLDKETESEIIKSFNGIMKNKFTIIISHKDSFEDIATQKIYMDVK